MGMFSSTEHKTLTRIVADAKDVWAAQPSIVELPTDKPILVVGDTHGDFETVEHLLNVYPGHTIVFDGDIVDVRYERGNAIRALAAVMQAAYDEPERVYVVRGDHEFKDINTHYGLLVECIRSNIQGLYDPINNAFGQLPYLARTENGVVIAHGGLPLVSSVSEIQAIPKGLVELSQSILAMQIVMSDFVHPKHQGWVRFNKNVPVTGCMPNIWRVDKDEDFMSPKEIAALPLLYNSAFAERMLSTLGASVLVRGHDYHAIGVTDPRVITVHTAQSYVDVGRVPAKYVALIDPQVSVRQSSDVEILTL